MSPKVNMTILVLALMFMVWKLTAQDKPKYSPSEVQTLRLQVKQRDAQLAQRDVQFAQQRFQQTIADLNAEADRIKTENHWPAATTFNPDSLTFSEPPKPAAAEKPAAPVVKP